MRRIQVCIALGIAIGVLGCSGGGSSGGAADEFVTPDGSNVEVSVGGGGASTGALSALDSPDKGGITPPASSGNEGASGTAGDAGDDDDSANPEYAESSRDDSVAEHKACAAALGLDPSKVVFVGNKLRVDLSVDAAIFLKIRGNKASATVHLRAPKGDAGPTDAGSADGGAPPRPRIPGVCIVVAGNKASVTIEQEVDVGKLVYRARGNKSQTLLQVKGDARLEAAELSVTGNKAVLLVQGGGSLDCQALNARVVGNKTSFTCTP